MITISTKMIGKEVVKLVDMAVERSLQKSSEDSAKKIKDGFTSFINMRATKQSNKLANSWVVLKSINYPGLSRTDIVSDCPYAIWAELGKHAQPGAGLPYGKSMGKKNYRDFSKSEFEGLHYIRDSLRAYNNPQLFGKIIFYNMVVELIKSRA